MRELTFFTTNATKLAHARYLAEGRQVRIVGFRQRTYHAGYSEPRLDSREAVLDASYRSARQQLVKAGFSENSHPFILEDTSVRIDALSGESADVPGVDIKYWMEGRTFSDVDAKLRAAGNQRGVRVRSDVLLHVPSSLKRAWGVTTDYIIFVGEQTGVVVNGETQFDSNPVYPWLDNRSFNKWFQPDGCDRPLGALPIQLADPVDFRRKSFRNLFAFLEERRFFPDLAVQMILPLETTPNLIICGYPCSGKTTASQHLARNFNYLHIEASDFMYLSYFYRNGYNGAISIGDFAENALAQKPTIAAEKVVEYVFQHLSEPIVISGFRAPEEIAYVKDRLASYGKKFDVRFIHADESARYKRMMARARVGEDTLLETFRERDRQQDRMGLGRIEKLPVAMPLRNDGSLLRYCRDVEFAFGVRHKNRLNTKASLQHLESVNNIGLEDAILIALLSVWEKDENRPFFTTTQIAGLLARVFTSIQPKHKDNVSRYFNQDFYPYYDIASSRKSSPRKYRLSNTGYGAAIKRVRGMLSQQATVREGPGFNSSGSTGAAD